MMGAGVVSGFEIKNQAGQLAAVSFYEAVDEPGRAKSLAWQLPKLSPGWSDSILATLAIAYVFPWPTACDARHLAGKADQ